MVKKDSRELEKTITWVLVAIILLMPISYIIDFFGIYSTDRASMAGVILVIGSAFLLLIDIVFVCQKENRGLRVFDVIVILLFVSLILSTIFAVNIELALSGNDLTEESSFVLGAYIIVAYSASLITEQKNKKILYYSLVCFGIIQVLMGLFQSVIPVIDNQILESMGYRAFGTMSNSNPYGSIMVLLACLECGLFYESTNRKKRIMHGALLMLYLYSMFLSGTRGAYVGFFLAALLFSVYLIVKAHKNPDEKKLEVIKKLLVIMGMVVITVGIYYLTSKDVWNSVVIRTKTDVENQGFGEARLEIWKSTIDNCCLKYPVLGCGPSNMKLAFLMLITSEKNFEISVIDDAHNRLLNVFATQGIIGLVAYLLLLLYCIKSALKIFNGESDKDLRKYGYTGIIFAFLGYTFSDMFCIGMVYMAPYYYLLLGIMANRGSSRFIKQSKNYSVKENSAINNME